MKNKFKYKTDASCLKNGKRFYRKKKRRAPLAKQQRPTGTVRLNKAIAESGYCSRREADTLIACGVVKVNGVLATIGQFVHAKDQITINDKLLRKEPKKVYLAFNKPVGIECTTNLKVRDNIVDFIAYHERIFPIGRLDKDSEGLILLTNNGDVVNPILRAESAHEKEYVVQVNKPISKAFIEEMAKGVNILNRMTLPCKIHQINKNTFGIVLVQGLNRQIRRMCETLGYKVTYLKRIRIMSIELGSLKTGTYRVLKSCEVDALLETVR